jgi:hypothetical protein
MSRRTFQLSQSNGCVFSCYPRCFCTGVFIRGVNFAYQLSFLWHRSLRRTPDTYRDHLPVRNSANLCLLRYYRINRWWGEMMLLRYNTNLIYYIGFILLFIILRFDQHYSKVKMPKVSKNKKDLLHQVSPLSIQPSTVEIC